MKVIFIGTPQIAADYLKSLFTHVEISLVITQKPKAQGRGLKVLETPVSKVAKDLQLELLEVDDINHLEVVEKIKNSGAKLAIVIAFGQIIRQATRESLAEGFINLHFSLLPALRGADPVAAAIRNGLSQTGVSVFKISEGIDDGDIYVSKKIDIDVKETTSSLFEKLKQVGQTALLEALASIKNGVKPTPQQGEVSYAAKTSKADYQIPWDKPQQEIERLIRSGMNSKLAWTLLEEQIIKIGEATITNRPDFGVVGSIKIENGVTVQTGDGVLEILTVIPAGKAIMNASQWARGLKITSLKFR